MVALILLLCLLLPLHYAGVKDMERKHGTGPFGIIGIMLIQWLFGLGLLFLVVSCGQGFDKFLR